jgi:hypothetical protein
VAQPNAGRIERGGFGNGQSPAVRNDRPLQNAPQPQMNQATPRNDSRGGFSRFGSPGNGNAPAAPRQEYRQNLQQNDRPQFNGGGQNNRQEPLRISPPVVRERPQQFDRPSPPQYQGPRYEAPRQSMPQRQMPSYNPPQRQSAPSYSPPARQSAPSYSAPRGNSGGGGGGGSRPSGGGGGGGSNHGGGNGGHGGGRR